MNTLMVGRSRLFALFLALALVAGPVAAACSDCCPKADGPATLAPAAGCCGDCEPSLASAPDRASASLRAAVFVPQPEMASATLTDGPATLSISSSPATALDSRALEFSPPRTPSPLRL